MRVSDFFVSVFDPFPSGFMRTFHKGGGIGAGIPNTGKSLHILYFIKDYKSKNWADAA